MLKALWRVFVDGPIDKDEQVAYSKTKYQTFPKSIPTYDQNGWKPIPFGALHTYLVHIREYHLPLPG